MGPFVAERVSRRVGIRMVEGGFPHSEILGSKLVRSSPRLIAAYHVLHRLSAPRHPPNALKALDHSHDRCPPPGGGNHRQKDQRSRQPFDYPSVYACQPGPRSTRRFKRYGWSARDVDPRFSNLVPLHDFKHPRLPHMGAIDANLNDTGRRRDTLAKAGCLGGARRDRTDDLMLAKHALSQLSYGPFNKDSSREAVPAVMVGLGRLERPTSPLSGVRSNHLSYRPEHGRTAARGAALPITHCPEKKEKRRRRRPAYGA